jgi:hypothetical protein
MRTLVIVLACLIAQVSVAAQTVTPTGWREALGVGPYAPQYCCKVCTVGKPCGNTCIRESDTCHVGPGCACSSDPAPLDGIAQQTRREQARWPIDARG